MDFKKTEEQELLLESLRELIQRNITDDYIRECEENGKPAIKLEKVLFENGFHLLGIPEEFGGTPVDAVTMCMMGEELFRLGMPISPLGNALQVDDVLSFGTEEQKEIVLKGLVETGEAIFSLGITEPQAGSDNNAITTTAVTRADGKVVINGHKSFISNAKRAPYMMCVTLSENPPDEKHLFSTYFVPMDTPGIKLEQMHKLGHRTTDMFEVYLEDVVVEPTALMGKEGYGFINLMKNFEVERLIICASLLGMAVGAYEDAGKYANQRVQFGKSIGTFQLIQEKIAQMAIKIEHMRNMIYKCAWEKDNDISVRTSSALVKLYCPKAAFEVIDEAMQILGGIGYTTDHRVNRLWRHARLYRIGGGTDEVMIHIAGRQLLNQFK